MAAFARAESDSMEAMERQAAFLRDSYGAQATLLRLPRVTEVSSTFLRSRLREDRAEVRDLLWCQVYGSILAPGLYGVKADLRHLDDEDLRRCSWSMDQGQAHPPHPGLRGGGRPAGPALGGGPGSGPRAGILHDCTSTWTWRSS